MEMEGRQPWLVAGFKSGKSVIPAEKEEAMETIAVYEDEYGTTRCGECTSELYCDENGDMPDKCPCCGTILDYRFYDNK